MVRFTWVCCGRRRFHIQVVSDSQGQNAAVQLEDYKDAVAVLVVKARDAASPAVRINVTIPDQMLKRNDRHAAKHGLTRSGFLVLAAKKEIETLV